MTNRIPSRGESLKLSLSDATQLCQDLVPLHLIYKTPKSLVSRYTYGGIYAIIETVRMLIDLCQEIIALKRTN